MTLSQAGRMAGRRVLITGGASGIGRATAELFQREGARLALLDRNEATLAGVAATLGAEAIACDIAEAAASEAAVRRAAERMVGLDGVVNAAGVSLWQRFEDTTDADWRRILDINLMGAISICRAALPFLRAAPGRATIVNIASGAGLVPLPRNSAYCVSKAGLVMFTKALALDIAGEGVRVNAVCPGLIDTPMVQTTLANSPDPAAQRATMVARYPMGRMGEASEIASAILFLSCAESSYATGTALAIDGGRTLR